MNEHFEKVKEIVGHYTRLSLDANGQTAEAEAEIEDAFQMAESSINAEFARLEKRIRSLENDRDEAETQAIHGPVINTSY